MNTQTVTLIRGDGIGTEITEAVERIFDAADVPIKWEEAEAGLACVERYGTGLPQETLDSVKRNRVALKAPTTTPIGKGHKSVNVTLRKSLDLFANVRPAKSLPGVKTRFENIDLLLFRENIEDTYAGIEHWQTPDVVQCLKVITRPGSELLIRYAFKMAQQMNRQRVTCVHKANIHKHSDGLFLDVFRQVASEYPNVETDDILVDNLCMQLVSRPDAFDALILPNLYGDIVSDLCAGLVGGLGIAPGGNIGTHRAVFEAVHGSAPDIAGKGLANPTALLQSAILMLHYLQMGTYATRIEQGLYATFAANVLTRDLGGQATTQQFTQAVIDNLPALETSNAVATDAFGSARDSTSDKSNRQSSAQPSASSINNWTVRGVDIFVRHDQLPDAPPEVGNLKLVLISNRGTKIYPPPTPDIYTVNWYRLRYKSDDEVKDSDIAKLLNAVAEKFYWMHVEKLHYDADGNAMFSKAQGE